MAKKIEGEKLAATLTIYGAAKMSKTRRAQLADWLRAKADDLVKDGNLYSGRFVARRHFSERVVVASNRK